MSFGYVSDSITGKKAVPFPSIYNTEDFVVRAFSFSKDHALLQIENKISKEKSIFAWGETSNQKLDCLSTETSCRIYFQTPQKYDEILQATCAGLDLFKVKFVALSDRSVFFDGNVFCVHGSQAIVAPNVDASAISGFEIPPSQLRNV